MTKPTAEVQTALPIDLPDYHGRKPVGMKTSLTGTATRIQRPHSIGDKVVLVVEVRIKKAGHEDTNDGLIYAENLHALDMFELSGDPGARLLANLRSTYRTAADAAEGLVPAPGLGDVGYADGSGVVLTPEEVAELRGDPVRAMLDPDRTPVVVVYSDGSRRMWPDEFPPDQKRPTAGSDWMHGDPPEIVFVDKILHHATGEELEVAVERSDPLRNLQTEIDEARLEDGGFDPGATLADDDDPDTWEAPDAATAARMAEAEAENERRLPTSADFALVDQQVKHLPDVAAKTDTLDAAWRLLNAERQGRGRGLKPRQGAIVIFENRIAALEREAQS